MIYESKPLTNIGEIRHRRREEITYRNGIFKGEEMVLELKSRIRLLNRSENLCTHACKMPILLNVTPSKLLQVATR